VQFESLTSAEPSSHRVDGGGGQQVRWEQQLGAPMPQPGQAPLGVSRTAMVHRAPLPASFLFLTRILFLRMSRHALSWAPLRIHPYDDRWCLQPWLSPLAVPPPPYRRSCEGDTAADGRSNSMDSQWRRGESGMSSSLEDWAVVAESLTRHPSLTDAGTLGA
jgi:hypothetical protein